MIASWTGIWALISSNKVPEMHIGIPLFIPKPVTDYSTIYTSILSFVNMSNQLNQEALPLFCDEGVFRDVFGIYL